jgi:hypothetical protein
MIGTKDSRKDLKNIQRDFCLLLCEEVPKEKRKKEITWGEGRREQLTVLQEECTHTCGPAGGEWLLFDGLAVILGWKVRSPAEIKVLVTEEREWQDI